MGALCQRQAHAVWTAPRAQRTLPKRGRDDLGIFFLPEQVTRSYGAKLSPQHPARAPCSRGASQCISRESSPGHIDGSDVFYHETTDHVKCLQPLHSQAGDQSKFLGLMVENSTSARSGPKLVHCHWPDDFGVPSQGMARQPEMLSRHVTSETKITKSGDISFQLAVWSSGMILAQGARGPGLNSQNSPLSPWAPGTACP